MNLGSELSSVDKAIKHRLSIIDIQYFFVECPWVGCMTMIIYRTSTFNNTEAKNVSMSDIY